MKLHTHAMKAFGAAILLSGSSQALDFSYSFVNHNGSANTTEGAVVTGKILGLNDNMVNFQPVTVTLDSISPDNGLFSLPFIWFESGTFDVLGGMIQSAQFSKHDPNVEIDLNTDTGGRVLINKPDWETYYINGTPEITFTALNEQSAHQTATPDGGASTVGLLALSAAGIASVRRFASKV
jgi:hypothetical protein